MVVKKSLDKTSPQFFTEACVGKAIPEIKIDLCHTGNSFVPYAQFTLKNVLISEYAAYVDKGMEGHEWLALNFAGMEIRYISTDKQQNLEAPVSAFHDISSVHPHATTLQRRMEQKNDDGFNIFLATVYGEAVNQSEVAWQAVASTMVNRVNNLHFKCGKKPNFQKCNSIEMVVEQPAWYSAYHGNKPFNDAYNYLTGRSKTKPLKLEEMIVVLKPIYYQNEVITNADHYYSPVAQAIGYNSDPTKYRAPIPYWIKKGLREGKFIEIAVPGLRPTDDFKFFKAVYAKKHIKNS